MTLFCRIGSFTTFLAKSFSHRTVRKTHQDNPFIPFVQKSLNKGNGNTTMTKNGSKSDKDVLSSTSSVNLIQEQDVQPTLMKLLLFARPEFSPLFLSFILMVMSESTGFINPLLIAKAYDVLVNPSISNTDKMSDISFWMSLVLGIHTLGMITGFFRSSVMGVAGERVVSRLRLRLFGSIISQEPAFFDTTKTGELVSRLSSDTTLMQTATSSALPEVVLGFVKLVVGVGLMFWISVKLAAVTIAFAFFMLLTCVPFGKKIGGLAKLYQDALGQAQERSTEALGSIRTVQSFAAEEREKTRFKQKIGDPDIYTWWIPDFSMKTTYALGFTKSIWTTGFFVFLFGVGFGGMYAALWYGFQLVLDGDLSLGDLTAFQSYIFQVGSGLAQTSRFAAQVMEARGASVRILTLLERTPKIPGKYPLSEKESKIDKYFSENDVESFGGKGMESNGSSIIPSSVDGSVELSGVHFSYPSRPDVEVLHNFSLRIPPNTTTALVGPSGAGKSTVVSLIQRFYDVDKGSVCLDGIDTRCLDVHWLRRMIGYVQQEPVLFGISIRDNVTYGMDLDVSQEEVEKVCRDANAHEFISKWPDGYDTLVGERGVTLSGGQKQRIAIARALLINPKILLLDEATSALDAENEHLVQEAIDKAITGRTVLIVAHRLSTIKNADMIVVIDDHKIIDTGNHNELLQRCKQYQELIKRQSMRQ